MTGPPGNPALEQALLGELLNHGSVDAARALLGDTGAAFGDPFHGRVYEAITGLHAAGRPVDGHTVPAELNGHLRADQKTKFLDLVSAGGLARDTEGHAAEVARLYQQRRLLEDLDRARERLESDPARAGKALTALAAAIAAAIPDVRRRQASWSGSQLMLARFDPIRWAVPGLIPSGLTLFVGAPKLGKSWLALDIALAVATGGVTLGRGDLGLPVEAGDVLYLALEDGPRRIQSRLRTLMSDGSRPNLDRLHIQFEWPQDTAGVAAAERWLDDHPDARMIVVDTLARIRGEAPRTGSAYSHDTSALAPWQALAMSRNVAVVFVHHVRKAKSEDFVNEVSGTNGLAGVADVTLALNRARLAAEATLKITGRDVEEAEFTLRRTSTGWELTGAPPEDPNLGDLSRQIISTLLRHPGGISPSMVAALTAQPQRKVNQYLGRLEATGRAIRQTRGVWTAATAPTIRGASGVSPLSDGYTPSSEASSENSTQNSTPAPENSTGRPENSTQNSTSSGL